MPIRLVLFCLLLSSCGVSTPIKTVTEVPVQPEPNHLSFSSDPGCFTTLEELNSLPPLAEPDLWDRIREGYGFASYDNKRIDNHINWFKKHPEYLNRVFTRGEPYLFYITEEIEKRGIPMEIALLPVVESAFDPFAYSHGRASGIWQIIPGTGKMLGLKQNWWYDGRRDIVASTDAALNYLEQLNRQFKGDWLLSLAAYNSGAGNVYKAIKRNKKRDTPIDYWHLKLPRETMAYVPKLIALSKVVQQPEKYGITFKSIANDSVFTQVNTGSQIDLAEAAEMASISMDHLYKLNPAFNRWATDPQGPHRLLVPKQNAEIFTAKLAAIPQGERVTWERYKIRQGDTLSTIAQKYKMSVASLQAINKVKGSRIRAGKTLLVPVASKDSNFYSMSEQQRLKKRRDDSARTASGEKIDYMVRKGDSLWSIAKEFQVSATKIARWNNMAIRDPIFPGQVLAIWSNVPSVKTANSNGVIRKVSYRVRHGDSLYKIANRFKINVNDILQWNKISKAKYLQPGQSLTLFVDVTRVNGS